MLVSILVNNHNYGRFLAHAVDSALAQTYSPVEVIVCDDASTDDSMAVLERYRERVRVLEVAPSDLAPCFRQASAIHRAFEVSRGEVVCLLDSDDAFHPDKVARVVEAFRDRDDVVLVQHAFREVRADGRPTGVVRPRLSGAEPRRALYRTHSFRGVFTQTSGLSFRRSYLERVLPIVPDELDKIWADVRLTRRSVFYGDTITLREPLGEYRSHGANDSAKLDDPRYFADAMTQMYELFNREARARGWDTLSLAKSATRPELHGVRRLTAQWSAAEGAREKVELLRYWVGAARDRLRRRS